MSQSDYIKYKKTSYLISDLKKMPSTIGEGEYLSFNQYSVENTNIVKKLTYNQLSYSLTQITPTYTNIFGMEKNISNCKNNNYSCPYSGVISNRTNYIMAKQIGNSPVRPYLNRYKKPVSKTIYLLPQCVCTNIK
jgi:hypothetical protein